MLNREEVFKKVLDCSFTVHTALGPGLLESAYEQCLAYEMREAGLIVEHQKALPLSYKDVDLESGFRIDLLVNDCVIVEVKSVDKLNEVHLAQILTYLKLSGCKLGLLANFNVRHFKNGFQRVIF